MLSVSLSGYEGSTNQSTAVKLKSNYNLSSRPASIHRFTNTSNQGHHQQSRKPHHTTMLYSVVTAHGKFFQASLSRLLITIHRLIHQNPLHPSTSIRRCQNTTAALICIINKLTCQYPSFSASCSFSSTCSLVLKLK